MVQKLQKKTHRRWFKKNTWNIVFENYVDFVWWNSWNWMFKTKKTKIGGASPNHSSHGWAFQYWNPWWFGTPPWLKKPPIMLQLWRLRIWNHRETMPRGKNTAETGVSSPWTEMRDDDNRNYHGFDISMFVPTWNQIVNPDHFSKFEWMSMKSDHVWPKEV